MAINKKLIHFNKEDSFTNEKDAGNILDTSIVFVKDAKKIITHSSEYPAVNWGKIKNLFITSEEAKAGDVCFYDSLSGKIRLAKIDNVNPTDYPTSRFTPIGVVVIPGSHDVYGTGQCGVVSLTRMSYSFPDTGGVGKVYETIYFGGYNDNISELTDFNYAPYVGNLISSGEVGDSTGTVIGQDIKDIYLPAHYTYFSNPDDFIQCPHDTKASYYITPGSNKPAPSPYLTDGSRNSSYYQTSSPSSANNCLSDFDGIGNTNKLINLATGQSDWKTASTITNNSGSGYYPAACCCWRFHTDGTKQGDWYLPACGELGYLTVEHETIFDTSVTLSEIYNIPDIAVNIDVMISSSEYSNTHIRIIRDANKYIGYVPKSSGYYIIAFLRV
ncbi:hypothetical protein [Intestinibacter sp.]|uniref:hypothetical protein n=1 Tax=Intestinibacter sp. TaxID=1965304 RepID=UPI003F177968